MNFGIDYFVSFFVKSSSSGLAFGLIFFPFDILEPKALPFFSEEGGAVSPSLSLPDSPSRR